MNFTIYIANCTGNASNCTYPNQVAISSKEDLAFAALRDHVFAEYKNNRRLNENFIASDVISMDCDNDHSDDPKDWLTAEKLVGIFKDVDIVIYPSRHHMLPKGSKAPRPKYHILFPVPECRDAAAYADIKAAIQSKYSFFDGNALDAARFFFGSTCDPEDIIWHEGGLSVDKSLSENVPTVPIGEIPVPVVEIMEPDSSCGGAIYEGSRNNTMSRFAGRVLIKYGSCDKAYRLFRERAEKCEPPLSEGELISIWNSAQNFAGKIQRSDGYVQPEKYNVELDINELLESLDDYEKHKDDNPDNPDNPDKHGDIDKRVDCDNHNNHADSENPAVICDPDDFDISEIFDNFKDMKPEDKSDLGEAKVFCRCYRKELRYTKATDYLRYDDVCWREEPQLALGAAEEFLDLQLADADDVIAKAEKDLIDLGIDKDLVKSRSGKLMQIVPEKYHYLLHALIGADSYRNFVMRYRNYRNIMNFLNASRPMLAMDISRFDSDPKMLNTPSGTYNLADGMSGIHKHSYKDYITKVTNVSPGDRGEDIWQEALNTFFCGDKDLIDYVQLQVGMAAIGKVYQERMIIAYGGGANGKSTFWNTIFRVLGTYAGKISADALTVNCKRNVKPEMAELKGKRLIIASELEEGMRLNTAMVKQLCSTDEIQAEKKYKDPFHFVPSHTLVLYTNYLPKVGANDDGIWRRLIVIPFNAKITGRSDVKNYADYLYDKAGSAILKWIIEGAEKAIQADFHTPIPPVVQEAIDRYRESSDWLSQFVGEYCDVDPSFQEKSGKLYQNYRSACNQNGEYVRSTTDFYGALEKAGFYKRRTNSCRMITGLKLKEEYDFPDM